MALINAKKIDDKEKIKLEINKEIYAEIQKYCAWAGINEMDHFFEEAASFIFSKDKDWKNYERSIEPKKTNESV
ncbi:hypothetical protein TUM19329_36090 (plasmid) [Legionella antarctica]|uniref:Uncharacterized protein n=1 Tax=Legionella antarctica TaxID=2708020 RepID=A0A6F8TA74_9GAMM|nr:hypothetical protein [Legionella antarctica]BCA97248.1 hypothetical protein TUM19329_36090 [Legionella antarctica]